jgi:hypothetical protein
MRACLSGLGSVFQRYCIRPFPFRRDAGGGVVGAAGIIATFEKRYGIVEDDRERLNKWAAPFSDGGNIAVREKS